MEKSNRKGSTLPWTKKHEPGALAEFTGQEDKLNQVMSYVKGFKRGRALLVQGTTGTGKTLSVHLLAKELGYELLEINASDVRNADSINSIVGNALQQRSLFAKNKLILIDELDGISGSEDRGGIQAIAKLIDNAAFPVIITANDVSEAKFNPITRKAIVVDYARVGYLLIFNCLKKICSQEDLTYDEDSLKTLARMVNGDLRAAVNDLQSLAGKKITRETLATLSSRDVEEDIRQALVKVFKTTDPKISLGSFDAVSEDINKLFLWIEENLPREYTKTEDLAAGFENLSLADVFFGRIRRWQHYRFYVYCYDLLSAGISLSKHEKYPTVPDYKPTSRLLKIWMANQKNFRKKAIAEKVARKNHTSIKRAMKETMPYLKIAFKKDMRHAELLTNYLQLDKEETEWMAR
ncbi:MAG: replication factor C large subunit [Nanoarchaeota archaeon]